MYVTFLWISFLHKNIYIYIKKKNSSTSFLYMIMFYIYIYIYIHISLYLLKFFRLYDTRYVLQFDPKAYF